VRPGPALVIAAVLLGAASPAAADPPSGAPDPTAPRLASLAWVRGPGAESCIGPVALSEALARTLGREALAAPARASLAIEGHVERVDSDGSWRATLAVVTQAGEVQGLRELRSAALDCRALDGALALVLALLIEPGAVIGPAHVSPREPALVPVTSLPAPPAPPPAPHAPATIAPSLPAPAPPWRIDAEAGLMGGAGLLPGGAAAGVALDAYFTPPGWPAIAVGGAFWPSRAGGTALGGANFSLGWGSLSLCPIDLEADGNGLRLCFGGTLGAIVAETTGLAPAARKIQLVYSPDVALRYRRQFVGPVTVGAGASLSIPTARPSFYYLDTLGMHHDIFQQGSIGGTVDLTLGIRFR
jgi:hypothetical protein